MVITLILVLVIALKVLKALVNISVVLIIIRLETVIEVIIFWYIC